LTPDAAPTGKTSETVKEQLCFTPSIFLVNRKNHFVSSAFSIKCSLFTGACSRMGAFVTGDFLNEFLKCRFFACFCLNPDCDVLETPVIAIVKIQQMPCSGRVLNDCNPTFTARWCRSRANAVSGFQIHIAQERRNYFLTIPMTPRNAWLAAHNAHCTVVGTQSVLWDRGAPSLLPAAGPVMKRRLAIPLGSDAVTPSKPGRPQARCSAQRYKIHVRAG
jgi:hypothetical protein